MTDYLNNITNIRGPVPFWFINGHISRESIASEFDEMRSKGMFDVIVHPRYGLTVEYLSEDWFRIFGWCVEEAKARDMHLWIYDELNWPSGTAGMTVQLANPQFMGKYLAVSAVPKAEIDLSTFEPGQFLMAAKLQSGRITKTRILADRHAIKMLDDTWHVFNCHIKRDKYYIDTLSKAAVDFFKERTHEEYFKRFGDEFGKTIRVAFTDEPSIYWVSVGYDDWNLPYTEKLFQSFEEKYHYSAVINIPYLYLPGDNAPSFRADFWEHVANLFNTNYHGNLAQWCRDHNLIYTGHNNCEEPLRYQIRFEGDMFGTMKTMDIPGVDHLRKATLGNSFISIIGHKIASSHAHAAGKPRVMSESFGIMDWDARFIDLKKVVDWQFALGVNLLVPHALFHTVAGPMKRESPPSFFFQSPMWHDFDAFSDYVERLSQMLTGGRHISKILMLYPLTGLHASYQTDRKTPEFECIDNILNSICVELIKYHLDFDLVDFPTLSTAGIENGKLALGNEQYDLLIVPYTPYMRPAEYQEIGDIAKQVETYFLYRSGDPMEANNPSTSNGVNFVMTEDLPGFVMRLRHSIDDGIHLLGDDREDIMILQREKDGKNIVFMVNRSEHPRDITARFTGNIGLRQIELETGVSRVIDSKSVDSKTETLLHFGPYQSFVIIEEDPSDLQKAAKQTKVSETALDKLAFETGENVALIFDFDYVPSGHRIDVRKNARCIPVNWVTPPDYTRFAGEYSTSFNVEGDPGEVRFVLDIDYALCQVYVNDAEVTLYPTQNWMTDPSDLSANITALIKEGLNTVRVISPTQLSEPVRMVGEFDVVLGDTLLIKPKATRDQFHLEETMPFYSGTVVYTTDFELKEHNGKFELDLGDVGDSATVYVNGECAGKRLWASYTFDITKFVKPGTNSLKIETRGNLANTMMGRRQPQPFGLRVQPKVVLWSAE
ncbi:MAG: glycosyl hydrolase [Armatimonadota bacterium]